MSETEVHWCKEMATLTEKREKNVNRGTLKSANFWEYLNAEVLMRIALIQLEIARENGRQTAVQNFMEKLGRMNCVESMELELESGIVQANEYHQMLPPTTCPEGERIFDHGLQPQFDSYPRTEGEPFNVSFGHLDSASRTENLEENFVASSSEQYISGEVHTPESSMCAGETLQMQVQQLSELLFRYNIDVQLQQAILEGKRYVNDEMDQKICICYQNEIVPKFGNQISIGTLAERRESAQRRAQVELKPTHDHLKFMEQQYRTSHFGDFQFLNFIDFLEKELNDGNSKFLFSNSTEIVEYNRKVLQLDVNMARIELAIGQECFVEKNHSAINEWLATMTPMGSGHVSQNQHPDG